MLQKSPHCPSCGASYGEYHIGNPVCPEEECPRCGRALYMCPCEEIERHERIRYGDEKHITRVNGSGS